MLLHLGRMGKRLTSRVVEREIRVFTGGKEGGLLIVREGKLAGRVVMIE